MRNSAAAGAAADANALVPAAGSSKPTAKTSRRAADDASGDSASSETSSSADRASQAQILPLAATPLAGLSFAMAANAIQAAASKSAASTANTAGNAPAASGGRPASRIDALGATVVRVQTQFAPSALFSSQIAASSADSPIQSAEAAALAPVQALSASKASSPQRSAAASKSSLPASAAVQADGSSASAAISPQQPSTLPPAGSASEQPYAQTDLAAASDVNPGKASGAHYRSVSSGSTDTASSRKDSDTSQSDAQASGKAPLAATVNPGVAPAAGESSFATPAQQISDGIKSSLPAATVAQTPNDMQQTAPDGPLKTITVALNPASLGSVAVELTLKSGQLGVKLQVEDPATARMLRQDDGALEKLLQSAGYSVQSLQVSLQSPAPAAAAAQTAQSGQNFSNQFNASSGGQQQQSSQPLADRQSGKRQDQRPGYGQVQDLDGGGSIYV